MGEIVKRLDEKPQVCPGCGRPGGYHVFKANDHWHMECIRRQFPRALSLPSRQKTE